MYRWVNRQMFARHSLFVLPHEKEDAGEEYEEGMPPVESMLQMLRTQLPQPQVADVICLFYLNKYCLPERCAMHLFGFFVLI